MSLGVGVGRGVWMGFGPSGEGAEGHDGNDEIGDDAGGGVNSQVEDDPEDRGEGGKDEAIFFMDS